MLLFEKFEARETQRNLRSVISDVEGYAVEESSKSRPFINSKTF